MADAREHIVHIGAEVLAQRGEVVGEGELHGQEEVGRVFGEFGASGVGEHQRGVEPGVQAGHPPRRVLVRGTDHDAVGVEEVTHRVTLPEELRVAHHGHVRTVQQRGDARGGADGHGGLVDHHAAVRQFVADLVRHGLDGGQVGGAADAHRGRQAQEHHIGGGDRGPGVPDELQPPRVQSLADEFG
ncbi:hypothetical protein SANTM175S_08985 [Streptomyces antimycoticus]